MDINTEFEKIIAESETLTEKSKYLKYSNLLLAKLQARDKHGADSPEVKKINQELRKEMKKLGIEDWEIVGEDRSPKTKEITEASEVDIKSMDKKAQLSIKYWTKLFKGRPQTAFDGIHGLIAVIEASSERHTSDTIAYLSKGGAPKYRWIEFDGEVISIGF